MQRKHGVLLMAAVCAAAEASTDGSAARADAEINKLLSLSLTELIEIPVSTASRRLETRDAAPAHILVFTRAQIRERRYQNLADLLADLPGVDFQRATKSSQYNQFSIQGATGPNRLVVMIDGVRIGHPAGGNIPVAENIALYPAKQVEVLFGPAAALYGADAVSGVVNIITDPAREAPGGWVVVGAGRLGTREASFGGGLQLGDQIALVLGGHWQHSDRAPLDEYFPAEFAKRDARTFGGVLVVPAAQREDYTGPAASHSLFARLDVGERATVGLHRNQMRSLTSTGDPPATAIYRDDSVWITTTDTVYAKYRFHPMEQVAAELVVDHSRMEVDPRAKYVNIYNGFSHGYSYVLGERTAIEQNFGVRLGDRHRVQGGVGFQKYYAIETASLPAPYDTEKGPRQQGYFYANTDLPLRIYDAHFDNRSIYAQIQSEWSPSFSTMAGMRHDHHSEFGGDSNPRLGAIWRPNPGHVFKLLYGEAFRAPSPEEVLSSFGVFDGSKDASGRYRGTGFRIPNFSLEPEMSKTWSLTWDWRPRPNLNVMANAYLTRIDQLIVTRPSTAVDSIPGAILIAPESKGNAGRQDQRGLDLMVHWRYQLASAWSGDLWGSASWVDGRIDEGNGVEWDLSHVARRKYKLGTTLRYRDWLIVTPQLLIQGDTANGRKNPGNVPPARRMTPGYTLINLHVAWQRALGPQTTLWLDVENLADKRYYAAHGSASRTFFDMPQQPRTTVVSVEVAF